jgi:crossover junction endonuclease EME1
MPVEIIDLVSSPILPRPARTKVNKTVPPCKALTYEASKPRNEDWFDLSSDGISLPPSKALGAKSSLSAKQILPSNGLSNPSRPMNPVGSNEFYFLSDDFDTTISPPNAPTGKRSTTSSLPKPNLDGSSKQNRPRNPAKTTNNVEFLSDDFDTAHFDDPFASDEPLPKKRRLTPSPKATSKTTGPKKTELKMSTSSIESSSKIHTSKSATGPGLRRSKTMSTLLESDPIMFTSSPDPFEDAARRRKGKRNTTLYEDGEEDDPFDIGPSRNEMGRKKVPSGNGILESGHGNRGKEFAIENSSDFDLPDIGSLASKPSSKTAKSSQIVLAKYNAEKAKEETARDKAEKSKEKQASKDAEKEQKRLAKEHKVRGKEKAAEMAKVNTLRTDKKVSAPEMIVDIPSCLSEKLVGQARNFLTPLQIEHSDWESSLPVIKWRRKAIAEWNDDMGHWEPVPLRIKTEKHIMCILSAKEFVDLAMADEGQDLDAHVLRLKAKFDFCEIIYMIEGLAAWMRKNRNVKNRQFAAAVRSHLSQEEQAPTASQRTKKRKEQEYVDEDMIEDALLRLQVIHGTLIHHTATMIETAEWIVTFTQHISTIPYKYGFPSDYQAKVLTPFLRTKQRSLDTAFCMESGQVKTGENAADTYTKMLQEIIRITAPIAYGIAAEYPTVQKLVKGLEENGPLALEDFRKCANKDGAFTDRRIGPSISKRVYKVFMGRHAASWDV